MGHHMNFVKYVKFDLRLFDIFLINKIFDNTFVKSVNG